MAHNKHLKGLTKVCRAYAYTLEFEGFYSVSNVFNTINETFQITPSSGWHLPFSFGNIYRNVSDDMLLFYYGYKKTPLRSTTRKV